MDKKNIIQLEISGNWRNIPVGFDWFTLREFNKDSIFIKDNMIIIKDQSQKFLYPKDVKFKANHFILNIENDVQFLYLNPTYLGITLKNKGLNVMQKISAFETIIQTDNHKISSSYCSYYGQPLIVDYEYKNTNEGALVRFVGNNFVECIVDYNQEEGTFHVKLYDHHILSAKYFKTLKLDKHLDSSEAMKMFLEEQKEFYNIMKHGLENVLLEIPSIYGKVKHV
jgi:hypothetical protein